MCNQLLSFARNHLTIAPAPPLDFNLVHQYVQHTIDRGVVGNETVNMDASLVLLQYVAEFVTAADHLQPNDIRIVSCDHEDGAQLNRKLRRTETDWVVVEHKSVAAYNAHRSQILDLARGEGTEILASSYETSARSIILKLGKHMIDANCRWGLLIGGHEFMVFFMNVVNHKNSNYYQMVVSDNHSTLTRPGQLQPLPEPCLISVVTALLLGNNPAASYTNPPTARIVTEYAGGRQSRTTRNTGGGNELKRAKRGEPALRSSRAGTTAGTRAHVHQETRRSSRLIEAASRLHSKHDYSLLSFPNSRLPDRQLALKRISAQKAWDVVLEGNSSDLPETTPEGEITYQDTVVEEPLCLLAMEKLGSGICGIAYDSLLVSGTSEEPCAIKVNEHDFQSFVREVEVYERLQGKTFIPKCYGGFAGMWVNEPFGVLVLELLEKSFDSFNEMTTDQKHQALACLEQLHDEGYHQGDVRASNFGLRNGQVVVLDFTHAEPCDTPRTCGNWEGKYAREVIFEGNC
ncbi:protein kinase domain-containing protein [Histoplasma capsulatum G186AR]|uniref:Protein kinase domain-containing protein n=1 Tax=Ajellomyces capsulatus TaxID=5037 RepID=A0A8H7YCU9_AJECA|nr:protein kinase domain-containing protein [Histoplasma capsulatum]QSS73311.1 protein kinase domain-containing protein [Histoplasma capsulatum G186AR]